MEAFVQISIYTLFGTAVLIAVGGLIGFLKAKSAASLIAGVLSGAALGGCAVFSMSNATAGLIASIVVLTLLEIMFVVRLSKTRKFMPSGMMLVITSIAQIVVIMGLVGALSLD